MKNILNFLNFDVFGAGTKGGTGVDKDDPTLIAYTGTPLADELTTMSFGSTWADPSAGGFLYNNCGVTGLNKHKIGEGAERRNTFVFQGGRHSTATAGKTMFWTAGTADRSNPGVAGKKWGVRFSFNLTDFTEFPNGTPVAHGISIVDLFVGSNSIAIANRVLASGKAVWNIAGMPAASYPPVVPGQPIHIEIEVGWENPPASGNVNSVVRVYINGDLVSTQQPWSFSQTAIVNARVRFTAQSAALTYMNSFGLSDLTIASAVGPNETWLPPLGPQVALAAAVESVDAVGWQTTGPNIVTALTDGDDATYVVSPANKTTLDAKINMQLPVGAEVNGLNVYARCRRDIPASAALSYSTEVVRQLDGSVVATDSNRPLTAQLVFARPVSILPNTPAGEAALEFADSGKLSVRLKVS